MNYNISTPCYSRHMTEEDKQELRKLSPELSPELSDEQLEEAHETLTRYAELLVRMVERRAREREDRSSRNNE